MEKRSVKRDGTAAYSFVLVHGGCHDGATWRQVAQRLRELGHTVHTPTVAGHGKGARRDVTHAQSTQSIVDYIIDCDIRDFILVGHGYAGTIISKVAEAVPDRIRRLVFWSAFVVRTGEAALDLLPGDTSLFAEMAAQSPDNTFTIPFELWRDAFINDADILLARSAYAQLSPEPYGPWTEVLDVSAFESLSIPRSFLVGTEDLVLPPGESGWHPHMSSRLGTFRLVQMPGSHEALFTQPLTVADKLIEAGCD